MATLPTITFVNNEEIVLIKATATADPSDIVADQPTAPWVDVTASNTGTPIGYVGYQGTTDEIAKDDIETLMTDGFSVYLKVTGTDIYAPTFCWDTACATIDSSSDGDTVAGDEYALYIATAATGPKTAADASAETTYALYNPDVLASGTADAAATESGLYPAMWFGSTHDWAQGYFSEDKDNTDRVANEDETDHYYVAVIEDTVTAGTECFAIAAMHEFSLGAAAGFSASLVAAAIAVSF